MGSELAQAGTISEIIRSACEPGWSTSTAMVGVTEDQAVAALDRARQGTMPLAEAENDLQGPMSRALINAIADIGCKIAPTMDDTAAQKWRVAMLKALSNLPGKVALEATKQAMGVPIRFIAEVELQIRELAEPILSRQRTALFRLEALMRELHEAAKPKLPPRVVPPLTADELRKMSPELRRMGLELGEFTQADLDAAGVSEDDTAPAEPGMTGEGN